MSNDQDLYRLVNTLWPVAGAEDVLRMRTGKIEALNSNGTVDVSISGVVLENIKALASARPYLFDDTLAYVAQWRGALLVLGSPVVTGTGGTVVKPSDTIRTSTITHTIDPHLQLPVAANAVYAYESSISWAADGGPDISFGHSAPTGSTLSNWRAVTNGTASIWTDVGANLAAVMFQAAAGTTANRTFIAQGTLRTSSTPGTFGVAWAQNSSSPNQTIVRADSWMRLTRTS